MVFFLSSAFQRVSHKFTICTIKDLLRSVRPDMMTLLTHHCLFIIVIMIALLLIA